MPCRAVRTLVFAVALFAVAAPAAGAPLYDMGPLLAAPHPFETKPPPLRRPATPPAYSGRLYDMGPLLDAPHPFDVPAAPKNGTEAGGLESPPLQPPR
jgi:hypothetical protein